MVHIETRDEESFIEVRGQNDLTIKAGQRLYSKAMERSGRLDSKREESHEPKELKDLVEKSRDNETTVIAGNRLYTRALDQQRRIEAKILEASKTPAPKLELMSQRTSWKETDSLGSARWDRLYGLSSQKQEVGKQRRTQIEEEKAKAKMVPETKILPRERVGDMYARSMERLLMHKIKLAEKGANV